MQQRNFIRFAKKNINMLCFIKINNRDGPNFRTPKMIGRKPKMPQFSYTSTLLNKLQLPYYPITAVLWISLNLVLKEIV